MANKLNQIVKVNTVNATSSVLTSSVNTVAIVVVGTANAAALYRDLESVEEDFDKTSEAYKMAKNFFSQTTHPDSLVIITSVSASASDIVDAVESATGFDFYHVVLGFAFGNGSVESEASALVTFVKDLNTKASEAFKMFHVETDIEESVLKAAFESEGGITESGTNRVSIWAHDLVATAIKRVVEITPVVDETAEGSKVVSVTIGSATYSADTSTNSTPKSICQDLADDINDASVCAFYASESNGKLILTAKVGGTDANSVSISANSTDGNVTVSKTSDVNGDVSPEHLGVAIVAQRCGVDPARGTWAHKRRLVGITPDAITASGLGAAKAAGYNVYTTVAGEARTFMGTTCSQTEFIDTIIKCDWIKFNVESAVYALLGDANDGYGVTYDDTGIQAIGAVISNILTKAGDANHRYIMDGYTVNVPKFASIDQANKNRRNVPNIVGNYSVMNYVHTVLDVTLNIVYPTAEEAA